MDISEKLGCVKYQQMYEKILTKGNLWNLQPKLKKVYITNTEEHGWHIINVVDNLFNRLQSSN